MVFREKARHHRPVGVVEQLGPVERVDGMVVVAADSAFGEPLVGLNRTDEVNAKGRDSQDLVCSLLHVISMFESVRTKDPIEFVVSEG